MCYGHLCAFMSTAASEHWGLLNAAMCRRKGCSPFPLPAPLNTEGQSFEKHAFMMAITQIIPTCALPVTLPFHSFLSFFLHQAHFILWATDPCGHIPLKCSFEARSWNKMRNTPSIFNFFKSRLFSEAKILSRISPSLPLFFFHPNTSWTLN